MRLSVSLAAKVLALRRLAKISGVLLRAAVRETAKMSNFGQKVRWSAAHLQLSFAAKVLALRRLVKISGVLLRAAAAHESIYDFEFLRSRSLA